MANGTLATDIKTFACKHTGVSVNYKKIDKWIDGSAMTDAKCDGVIYRKYNNNGTTEYYVDTQFNESGEITFERFGGKSDNTTDNISIFNIMQNAFIEMGKVSGRTFRIQFGSKGAYFFSDTIKLKWALQLIGKTIAKNGTEATNFRFPKGKSGIIVNRYNTLNNIDDNIPSTAADNAYIEGITLLGGNAGGQHSSFILDVNSNMAFGISYRPITETKVKLINRNNINYFESDVQVINNVRVVELTQPNTFEVGDVVTGANGGTGNVVMVGKSANTIILSDVDIRFIQNEEITSGSKTNKVNVYNSMDWWGVDFGQVFIFPTDVSNELQIKDSLLPSSFNSFGIELISRATIENVVVKDFEIDGIRTNSDFASAANSNCFLISKFRIETCGRHGISNWGGDSNAGVTEYGTIDLCGGCAIYDRSFLGNHHIGHHCMYCVGGGYIIPQVQPNNSGTFLMCYTEGGYIPNPYFIPKSETGVSGITISGTDGMGIEKGSKLGGFGFNLSNISSNKTTNTLQVGSIANRRALYVTGGIGSSSTLGGMAITHPIDRHGNNDLMDKISLFSIDCKTDAYSNYTTFSVLNRLDSNSYLYPVSQTGQHAQFLPIIEDNKISEVVVLSQGIGYKTGDKVMGTNLISQFVGNIIASDGGKIQRVDIEIEGNTSLINTEIKTIFTLHESGIIAGDGMKLGTANRKWAETHTEKIFLNGTELKLSEAPSNTANAIGATYSQSEVQAILDELRDLKNKLKGAGITA